MEETKKHKFLLYVNYLVLYILFFLLVFLEASAKPNEPDRFVSDRFIFLGTFDNKLLIATMEFARGFSEKGKANYIAEFNGHFLFAGRWHHMKNGNYVETNTAFPLEEIPDFEPCLMRWGEKFKSGAINYEKQEISFLLQFRDLKLIDEAGKSPDFLVSTGVCDSFLQFQGQQIPGKLIYRRMDLRGYNRLAGNFSHLQRRKFQEFFLLDEDGELFIIWVEQEGRNLWDQCVDSTRFIFVNKEGKPIRVSGNLQLKWTKTEKEGNPESRFRVYPACWEISILPSDFPVDRIIIENSAGFYWFFRGMSGVTGMIGSRKIMGLAEITRGE